MATPAKRASSAARRCASLTRARACLQLSTMPARVATKVCSLSYFTSAILHIHLWCRLLGYDACHFRQTGSTQGRRDSYQMVCRRHRGLWRRGRRWRMHLKSIIPYKTLHAFSFVQVLLTLYKSWYIHTFFLKRKIHDARNGIYPVRLLCTALSYQLSASMGYSYVRNTFTTI